MTRRLVLMRHGQTHYNATMRMQGQMDTELSELGRHQARVAAEVLARRRPVRIVSSDLTRAHDTALALGSATGLEVSCDERLRETDLGRWQGMSHSEVDALWPDARRRWRCDPHWAPPEGETRVDVARRTRCVVDELVASETDWGAHPVVLVAHGGAIAALAAALLELPVDHFPVFNGIGNTNWAQLSSHPRPDADRDRPTAEGLEPTTDAARDVLWRLDVWNATAHEESR